MKYYCYYHPNSQALWRCEVCRKNFCKLCIPDGDDKLQQAQCPCGKTELVYLDRKKVTEPFWEHKGAFVRKLLQAEVLLGLSALGLLALGLKLSPVFALATATILAFCAAHAAIQIARYHEDGLESPISVANLFAIDHIKESGLHMLILCVGFLVPVLTGLFLSLNLAIFLGVVLMLLLPSVLLMALHRSPSSARRRLERPFWYQIISKMGWAYMSLCGIQAIGFIIVLVAGDLFLSFLPYIFSIPLIAVIAIFILWFNYAAMGYVLRRYEQFNSVASTNRLKASVDKHGLNPARFEADLDIAIKSGEYEEALKLLEIALKKNGRSDLRRQQLYRLLIERNDLIKLEHYADSILELLLARGQTLQAYELVAKLKQANSQFLIHNIELIASLVEVFNEMKEYELVVWLAESCHSRFESSSSLSQVYLRAAKTHVSKLKQYKSAEVYLRKITKDETDEELVFAASRLLAHILPAS